MGSTHRTYYSTLDVSAQASQDDIRRSWRSLVLLVRASALQAQTEESEADRPLALAFPSVPPGQIFFDWCSWF